MYLQKFYISHSIQIKIMRKF